ncbi:MAG: dCTP deaminase [Candidatus Diapherotrites archaeon]|nr:dCTP deaminase [Candidatus Diapherotrites archaeon]MDN5366623.1 dCTP deaminase [Candidatus Diapherotrites archaeon]
MILGRKAILELMRTGDIRIEPFDESALGPASYDLALGTKFRVFDRYDEFIDIRDDSFDPAVYGDVVDTNGGPIEIMPGQLVLGITRERITLSDRVFGWISGRSRFARIGLLVHVSSNLIQPGVSNHQILEIVNLSPKPIRLWPGVRIAQAVFEEVKGVEEGPVDRRYFTQDSP